MMIKKVLGLEKKKEILIFSVEFWFQLGILKLLNKDGKKCLVLRIIKDEKLE